MTHLTKSMLVEYEQCEKRFWLSRHHPDLAKEVRPSLFSGGNRLGALARTNANLRLRPSRAWRQSDITFHTRRPDLAVGRLGTVDVRFLAGTPPVLSALGYKVGVADRIDFYALGAVAKLCSPPQASPGNWVACCRSKSVPREGSASRQRRDPSEDHGLNGAASMYNQVQPRRDFQSR